MSETPHCPDCGSPIPGTVWSEELCPHCLLELALEESSGAGVEHGTAVATPPLRPGSPALSRGKVLGNRYGLRKFLGRGGMGEVWHAFDLKLRVDVALKTVRPELAAEARVLETLRQEVRAAREVVSPNVCRVHDLQELGGRELVSMEYVDGTTLRRVLEERGPVELQEAREVAAQFLAGLDAIHQAGLVHRDIKPENIMITRTGRVVVMDFGIAKGLAAAQTGTVAGTPAYMAPEQERGEGVDTRADVFSAGVVLAEMLAPDGVTEREAREALWRGVRQQPPQLPESPWREVIETAVSHRPEQRYAAASDLARALEEVTVRVEGAEDVRPYPGLLAFSEQNREYFFGREMEAEALWRKIRRLHLLAVIGPSGAGKTSFLRAGLLASEPAGWAHVICTPGDAPLTALRQALVPELSGDSEAMRELVQVEDPDAIVSAVSRWRGRSRHALLVVDQLEELFTLNPPDVQAGFAELLGRLAVDADLHVLLSLRDDFLIRCNAHEGLRPILSELTVLGPPVGAALRRAIVQPALKCGYRFEDEDLVDRMLSEVEGERGVLPLVAFAAAQLWERRDRKLGVLTREAYEAIGGVGGALAQHAELTLERIGTARAAVVRELFRNLVTGEGTRAVRDRPELLSVFRPGTERSAAVRVLDALIDARLLTSYGAEAAEGAEEPQQRVEIVHESLLTAWPRLVRWQAQDVEGARMRDDLRQAARRWQERDRSDDLLWTGSAYREFQVWRERYPGNLSEVEDAFAEAMAAHAERRRRRRRFAIGTVLIALACFSAAVTWSRQQERAAREIAEAQARRADANQLLAQAQLELENDPTAAVAWATKSLELADTPAGRRFVLGALQRGPPARILNVLTESEGGSTLYAFQLRFRPDGSWVAMNGNSGVQVWPRDGSEPLVFDGYPTMGGPLPCFAPDGDVLATVWDRLDLWSFPEGRLLSSRELPGFRWCEARGERVVTVKFDGDQILTQSWPFDGGAPDPVVRMENPGMNTVDPQGRLLAWLEGREVYVRPLNDPEAPPRRVGVHDHETRFVKFSPDGQLLAIEDESGEIRIWPAVPGATPPRHSVPAEGASSLYEFDHVGSRLAARASGKILRTQVWDLGGPPDAEPLELRRRASLVYFQGLAFDPSGQWLATTHNTDVAFWPLTRAYPRVLSRGGVVAAMAFTPDGTRLVTAGRDGAVRVWPLSPSAGERSRVLLTTSEILLGLAVSPQGDRYLVGGYGGQVFVGSLTGGAARPLKGFPPTIAVRSVAFDPTGRQAAATAQRGPAKEKVVRVWDLETGEVRVLGPAEGAGDGYWGCCGSAQFTPDGRILVSAGGLRLWSLESGTYEVLDDHGTGPSVLSRDGRLVVYTRRTDGMAFHAVPTDPSRWPSELVVLDLGTRESRVLASGAREVALDPDAERFVAADHAGVISVGSVEGGEEPHLLLGHESRLEDLQVSPDGRWIASAGGDGTLRLWPMPEGRPFHTLPRDELLAKLHALTNLRVVPDERAAGGYAMTVGPFPGWEDVPTW
ncbi:MAG: protein kinase [Acidobacteria bacterium]|nr:protein kinase [Acidobacteriota bacterium]